MAKEAKTKANKAVTKVSRDARLGPENKAPERGLRLLVEVRALRSCDLEDGLRLALKSVEAGNTSGCDGNDDRGFSFSISGSPTDVED